MKHSARSINVLAAVVTLGSFAACGQAQVLLNISDGFGSGSFNAWSSVATVEAQSGTFLSSGGNPGTYAALIATTSPNNRTGTGFQYRGAGSTIVLGSLDAQISLGADLRRTSVVSTGTPIPQFVPFLLQSNRIYQPASFIAGPETALWTTVAPVRFNVSEFTNSSGIPLNPAASVTVGFWLRNNPAPEVPAGPSYGVGVDNVTLTVIPAPGAIGVGLAGLMVLPRRRRV